MKQTEIKKLRKFIQIKWAYDNNDAEFAKELINALPPEEKTELVAKSIAKARKTGMIIKIKI